MRWQRESMFRERAARGWFEASTVVFVVAILCGLGLQHLLSGNYLCVVCRLAWSEIGCQNWERAEVEWLHAVQQMRQIKSRVSEAERRYARPFDHRMMISLLDADPGRLLDPWGRRYRFNFQSRTITCLGTDGMPYGWLQDKRYSESLGPLPRSVV